MSPLLKLIEHRLCEMNEHVHVTVPFIDVPFILKGALFIPTLASTEVIQPLLPKYNAGPKALHCTQGCCYGTAQKSKHRKEDFTGSCQAKRRMG